MISNWLEPACARAAMATASPAIGMAAAVVVPDGAAATVVEGAVAVGAEKPKFGRPPMSGLLAPVLPCEVDGPAVVSGEAGAVCFATCVVP